MTESLPQAFSLVERGWRGARECSVLLCQRKIMVTHFIKGVLPPEVRVMIQPYPLIRVVDVPRNLFRLRYWFSLVCLGVLGRVQWILVDNERTLKELAGWCHWMRITPVLIHETATSYDLLVQGQHRRAEDLFRC